MAARIPTARHEHHTIGPTQVELLLLFSRLILLLMPSPTSYLPALISCCPAILTVIQPFLPLRLCYFNCHKLLLKITISETFIIYKINIYFMVFLSSGNNRNRNILCAGFTVGRFLSILEAIVAVAVSKAKINSLPW